MFSALKTFLLKFIGTSCEEQKPEPLFKATPTLWREAVA